MNDNQKKLNEQLVKVVFDGSLTDEVRLKKVKYLVRLGASVNQKVKGKSLLKIAREKGYKEIENVIKESLMKSFEEALDNDKCDSVLDNFKNDNSETDNTHNSYSGGMGVNINNGRGRKTVNINGGRGRRTININGHDISIKNGEDVEVQICGGNVFVNPRKNGNCQNIGDDIAEEVIEDIEEMEESLWKSCGKTVNINGHDISIENGEDVEVQICGGNVFVNPHKNGNCQNIGDDIAKAVREDIEKMKESLRKSFGR